MTRLPAAAAAALVVVIVALAAHRHSPLDVVAALILSPLACLVTQRAAARLAGPRFGRAAGWVYVALPLFGLAYALGSYRHTFLHGAVPELVGLRAPQWLALGVVVTAFASVAPETALGALGAIACAVALVRWGTADLTGLRNGLHETAWSIAFIEWTFVASVIGAAVRRPLLALAYGGWLAAVILAAAHGGYGAHGEFWRSLAPAAPAAAVLLSSIALLVPRSGWSLRARPSAG